MIIRFYVCLFAEKVGENISINKDFRFGILISPVFNAKSRAND